MTESLVLLVDDEPKVVTALTRELMEMEVCDVLTANNGMEALEILKKTHNIRVIVSDYYMPGMDGISFLCEAQKISPDTTRIMLTGAAGLEMAIKAVNLGQIFRFLLKPCPVDDFILAVRAGIRQHQLITGERELLQKTLSGSIKVMVDMLSALNLGTFVQSNRLRSLARQLAAALQMENIWEVELAALLCRIGSVTVPSEILDKEIRGSPLSEKESAMLQSIGRVGQQLVQNIPRLENIAHGIGCQAYRYTNPAKTPGTLVGEDIPIIGRILKLLIDYDRFLGKDQNLQAALDELLKHVDDYDPKLFAVFRASISGPDDSPIKKNIETVFREQEVNIADLEPGMVLVRDVFDRKGRLVISTGTVITEILKRRLVNYCETQVIFDPVVIGDDRYIF